MDNTFRVERVGANSVIVGYPPAHALSKEQAYQLAAWLVYRADELEGDFHFGDILEEIANEQRDQL